MKPFFLSAPISRLDHCTPTSEYLARISSAFNTCIPTYPALLSTTLGLLSIIAWLFAQLPQIYKNHVLGSASGLSILFLSEWLLGDVANLLGAILTGQASWQVGIAIYYVAVDMCLTSQYLWYSHLRPSDMGISFVQSHATNDEDDEDRPSRVLLGVAPTTDSERSSTDTGTEVQTQSKLVDKSGDKNSIAVSSPARLLKLPAAKKYNEKTLPRSQISSSHCRPSPRNIWSSSKLMIPLLTATAIAMTIPHPTTSQPPQSPAILLGQISSWLSTALYLGSRLPQIYRNAKRHSTAGLSPYMFLAAFCGNALYSAAILANPCAWASYPPYGAHGWVGHEGSDRARWVGLAAPFWLGAAGVLVLDATVGLQFLVYRGLHPLNETVIATPIVLRDEEGERGRLIRRQSQWTQISGWMRGWIPSPTRIAQAAKVNEDTPLLR